MRITTVFVIILAGISTALGVGWRSASTRAATMQAQADSLGHACSTWMASYDSLKKNCAPAPEEERDGRFWARRAQQALDMNLLSDRMIKELQAKGLSDPPNDLRNDLREHDEIIPLKPHGQRWLIGTILLLAQGWVYAEFEDGHYMGACLLKYSVEPGRRIRWEVLRAELL